MLLKINKKKFILLFSIFITIVMGFMVCIIAPRREIKVYLKYEVQDGEQTEVQWNIDGNESLFMVEDGLVQYLIEADKKIIVDLNMSLNTAEKTVFVSGFTLMTDVARKDYSPNELLELFTAKDVLEYNYDFESEKLKILTGQETGVFSANGHLLSDINKLRIKGSLIKKYLIILLTAEIVFCLLICFSDFIRGSFLPTLVKGIKRVYKFIGRTIPWDYANSIINSNRNIYITIAFLSLIGCIILAEGIDNKVYNKAKWTDVTVKVNGTGNTNHLRIIDNEVTINENGDVVNDKDKNFMLNFKEMQANIISNDGFQLIDEEGDITYSSYFEATSDNSIITFRLPIFPTTCLSFEKNGTSSGAIIIKGTNDNEPDYIMSDAFAYDSDDKKIAQKYYVFDTDEYNYIFFYYFFYYGLLFVILFVGICSFYFYIFPRLCKNRFLIAYNPIILFLCIFICQSVYSFSVYRLNPERFQVSSEVDAFYYMYPRKLPMFINEAGDFSLELYAKNSFSFRGYLPHLISDVFNGISESLTIDVMYFHMLFTAILSAIGIVFGMSIIYKNLRGRNPKNISIILVWLLYFLFWRGCFFFVLSDIPGAMLALLGIAFSLKGLREGKRYACFCAGLCLGGAAGYRASYGYLVYIILIIILYFVISKILKLVPKDKKVIKSLTKENVLSVFVFVFGLIVILFPQALLNVQKEHYGIFPFNSGWEYSSSQNQVLSLTESSFTKGIRQYGLIAPEKTDIQFSQIDNAYFEQAEYTMGDAVFLLLSNPSEFLSAYIKKLFVGFSIKGVMVYGAINNGVNISRMCYALNYFLIGTFIYCFIKGKNRRFIPKFSGLFYFVLAVILVFPQALLHIEQRYFLFYFLLIYFFYSFFVVDIYIENKYLAEKYFDIRYWIGIMIFVVVCYVAINTLIYNFF